MSAADKQRFPENRTGMVKGLPLSHTHALTHEPAERAREGEIEYEVETEEDFWLNVCNTAHLESVHDVSNTM